ncbi:unnamed protein product [Lepeophtheirus salmonis]|uniref:(salmon louse) hypothetical protein n=1 Tax=Lepeophtheirus salmonis TaxID=72036 RepID=A0A7R8DAA3_LEPSM|nr:unnamed protein product [Lepeophtheirus salmonis]CAF3024693.1 unnamed protein product [Lepeophtheirus salmonis]
MQNSFIELNIKSSVKVYLSTISETSMAPINHINFQKKLECLYHLDSDIQSTIVPLDIPQFTLRRQEESGDWDGKSNEMYSWISPVEFDNFAPIHKSSKVCSHHNQRNTISLGNLLTFSRRIKRRKKEIH